jgi:hypothetical protein
MLMPLMGVLGNLVLQGDRLAIFINQLSQPGPGIDQFFM